MAAQRQEVNDALVAFINNPLYFVRQTLFHYKKNRFPNRQTVLD